MTNIVLAMDSESLKHMNPLINSIKKNVCNPKIYLITDSSISIEWADEIAVMDCNSINAEDPYPRITKHTYYRLYIDKLFPNIGKCIYLDFDTIVCKDISDLLQDDGWIIKGYSINDTGFINAGVIAFNFENSDCIKLMETCRSEIGVINGDDDQKIINRNFCNKITFIDQSYNCMSSIAEFSKDTKILHYLGDLKPWIISKSILKYFEYVD